MQPIFDPSPRAAVSCTAANEGGGEAETGSLSPVGDEKRRWMTKDQAEACQKAFEEWNGSIKGKGAEVVALAESIGLTVSWCLLLSLPKKTSDESNITVSRFSLTPTLIHSTINSRSCVR